MQEGHIHAVANLLRAPVVVVDVRFASMAGLFEFAPGYEAASKAHRQAACGGAAPQPTERACGASKSGAWARGERGRSVHGGGLWETAGFSLLRRHPSNP
eukprot:6175691-Prymnesium_polylepis.1